MNYLKIIVIVFISLNFSAIYSQETDKYGFDYKVIDKEKILLPTWNNVFNTISMPTNVFMELMSEYDYVIDKKSNENKYLKNIKNITVSVKQIENGILFNWTAIELSTYNIENEFANYYKETNKGVKTYVIKKGKNNIIIKVKNKGINEEYLLVQIN